MNRIKAVILSNELPDDHLLWVEACKKNKELVNYRIVNLTLNNWLDEIQKLPFDILLAKPSCLTAPFKQLYDERIYVLSKVLGYKIFPSPEEIFIYENKRFLSYWLKANQISHPRTDVFYNRKEAKSFLDSSIYPIVAKTNIGASGSGVRILKDRQEALNYINRTFSGKGAPKRTGPNVSKGGVIKRGLYYIGHLDAILKKLDIYKAKSYDSQKAFVLFQEYIYHDFEWRVVRIGDSYFAHKKLKINEKTSGSLIKGYENPSFDLLNFIKDITDKYKLYSQAVDLFETDSGYLVNEMQCIFGQSDPYQMLVDGIPGRYRYIDNIWAFEKGAFNQNESYDLRINWILNTLR
jgi:glutathione synthase/RimK-type ligase-like ATP-grasp enzyme